MFLFSIAAGQNIRKTIHFDCVQNIQKTMENDAFRLHVQNRLIQNQAPYLSCSRYLSCTYTHPCVLAILLTQLVDRSTRYLDDNIGHVRVPDARGNLQIDQYGVDTMQMYHLPVEQLQARIADQNKLVRPLFDQDKVVLTFLCPSASQSNRS